MDLKKGNEMIGPATSAFGIVKKLHNNNMRGGKTVGSGEANGKIGRIWRS